MLAAVLVLIAAGVCVPVANADSPGLLPQVTSVTPNQGGVLGGQTVTINGSGFVGLFKLCAGSYDVWFGTDIPHGYGIRPSSFQVLSDSQISAVVPAGFGGPVDVQVHDRCGTSLISPPDQFTYNYPADECTALRCRVAVGATRIGALTHVGDGFLNGFTDGRASPGVGALVADLHPRQWRVGVLGPIGGPAAALGHCAVCRRTAAFSLDLTTDWENWAAATGNPNVSTPYRDLRTYSGFIYRDVKQRLASDSAPQYYDVWNEPYIYASINQWLSVYGAAYDAIKAADPTANVVGPSLAQFLIASQGDLTSAGRDVNLTDFLDWEMREGKRFAAITWHEDGTTVDQIPNSNPTLGAPPLGMPGGVRDYWSPAAIGRHVNAARALLGKYPALRGTKIFVNEYGPAFAVDIPGWMVGDFAALEASRADQGMITCATLSACTRLLDGLLGPTGTPQMPYWVMSTYAHMTGMRVPVSSKTANVFALATRVDRLRTMQVLLGRADHCWGGVQCPQFHAPTSGTADLSVSIAIPWRLKQVSVAVRRFPNVATSPIGANDVAAAPLPILTVHAPVRGHQVTVPIPGVHDGDAFYVTVAPSPRQR